MTRLFALLCAAAVVTSVSAAPVKAASVSDSGQMSDHSSAKKKKAVKSSHSRHYRAPAYGYGMQGYGGRTAFGQYRSDPSFDPSGRPWRPNFYAPCTEDLGYGRFKSCDSF